MAQQRDPRIEESLENTFRLWVRDCYPASHPDIPTVHAATTTAASSSTSPITSHVVVGTSRDPLPKTMREAVSKYVPHCSASSWPLRLKWGGLYLNGKPVRDLSLSLPVNAPFRFEYFEPKVGGWHTD
jgi:hypothetical protein